MRGEVERCGMRHIWTTVCLLMLPVALAVSLSPAAGAPLERLADSVQEFTLKNGLHVLVVEQHDAPVFAYCTIVDAGGVCEVPGITGIAHMFEHMAFKGTTTMGTINYRAERKAMAKVDAAWDEVLAERRKRFDADSTRLEELTAAFNEAIEEAYEYVVPNEFSRVLEENGARGMNASTGTDITTYYYSLPSNRFELCARLEADRLANPVLREFYKERSVVRNERRTVTESTPMGRLFEDFLTTAFSAHTYGNGVIGHTSDIENFHRRDALNFFKKHYVGRNMTVCFVGDITLEQVRKVAKKYFSAISDGPDPAPVTTMDPVHRAERRVIAEEDANPVVLIGWQCPASADPDYPAMELLMEILGGGRSSRLYERLVKEEQVATQAGAGTGLPGDKYPNQAIVFAYCAADRDPLEAEAMIYEEIDRLIAEGPTPEEVKKVKAGYLATTMRRLRRPSGLARALATADQIEGNWRHLFGNLEQIEAVTAEDIQRLAAERLIKSRRIVAMLKKPAEEESAQAAK
ncbi:MAG: insulinase family protein [Candidatus Eisenbacteria sp.]|nr:insulinase family protein [Candidatus Eisenbacteria bacterium]